MEDAHWEDIGYGWRRRYNVVLILILLEDAHWGSSLDYASKRGKDCLNPYFIGRCSLRLGRWTIQSMLLCLNPYFIGRCSLRSLNTLRTRPTDMRLNPYFIGRCSLRQQLRCRVHERRVLILILLEDAHWELCVFLLKLI